MLRGLRPHLAIGVNEEQARPVTRQVAVAPVVIKKNPLPE